MMKKIFLVLSVMSFILVSGIYTNAYSQCTPDASMDSAGLAPTPDELDCLVNGTDADVTIYFKNFEKVSGLTVYRLRIDSVTNMPCGLSYATNKTSAIYTSGEAGCLQVTGKANDVSGQYKLGIYVSIDLDNNESDWSFEAQEAGTLAAQFGITSFTYRVRLKANASDNCPAVDTSSGANDLTAACKTINITSVNEIEKNVQDLKITPNPFNGQTEISFYSKESGNYFAKLYDVVGKEVYSEAIQVVNGTNKFRLERGDLSKGVYMYTITDGAHSISKRVVIRD